MWRTIRALTATPLGSQLVVGSLYRQIQYCSTGRNEDGYEVGIGSCRDHEGDRWVGAYRSYIDIGLNSF